MRFFIKYFAFSLTLFFNISTSWSVPDTEVVHNWGSGIIKASGPADSLNNKYQTLFAVSGGYGMKTCNNPSLTYNIAKVEYTPIAIPTGDVYFRGGEFFATGAKGLIMLIQMGGQGGNYLTPGDMEADPLPSKPRVLWQGWAPNADRISYGFHFYPTISIFRGVDRIENGTIIPRQSLYRLSCYDAAGVLRETSTIVLVEVKIETSVTGCSPDSNIKSILMEGVPFGTIENASASTLIATKQQTFTLKCDPDIRLHYSVVDLNDPTNRTTTSTLTDSSTATGIGYAITASDGTRLQFGPDGSAQGIADQTKYSIGVAGNTGGRNNPMTLKLGFSYVRKPEEVLKTGSANSLIGITYSYQ